MPLVVFVGRAEGGGEERDLRFLGKDAQGLDEVRGVAVHDPHDAARPAGAAEVVRRAGS